jgi:hypothetical protein
MRFIDVTQKESWHFVMALFCWFQAYYWIFLFLFRLRQISIFRSARSLKALKLCVNCLFEFAVGAQNQKCPVLWVS